MILAPDTKIEISFPNSPPVAFVCVAHIKLAFVNSLPTLGEQFSLELNVPPDPLVTYAALKDSVGVTVSLEILHETLNYRWNYPR